MNADDTQNFECLHTYWTEAHAFDSCEYCERCWWCGIGADEHEGDV